MHKSIKFLLSFLLLSQSTSLLAQSSLDKFNLSQARQLLEIDKDCYGALKALRMVSDVGKTDLPYLLYSAKANDCIDDKEKAITFYTKYLESNPGDEAAKTRLAALKTELTTHEKNTPPAKLAREKKNKQLKGKNKANLTSWYSTLSINYGPMLGGNNAPYKSALGVSYAFGGPLFKKKAILDFDVALNSLKSGNTIWYKKAFNDTGSIGTISNGISVGLNGSAMYVLKNTKKYTLSAGPVFGARFILLATPSSLGSYGNNFSETGYFTSALGAKINFYVFHRLLVSAAYSQTMLSSVTTEKDYPAIQHKVPVNLSMLQIGIGYYLNHDY